MPSGESERVHDAHSFYVYHVKYVASSSHTSSVARAIADSLELKEVWDRVADACRAVVPFDGMGVSQLHAGDQVRVLVAAGDPAARDLEERVFARTDFSPQLWPREENFLVLVHEAERVSSRASTFRSA